MLIIIIIMVKHIFLLCMLFFFSSFLPIALVFRVFFFTVNAVWLSSIVEFVAYCCNLYKDFGNKKKPKVHCV